MSRKTFSLAWLCAAIALPIADLQAQPNASVAQPKPSVAQPKPSVAQPNASVAQPEANETPALVLAAEETTLSSQMAGRIRLVRVGLGDSVKKGSALIEFDCSEQQAGLDSAAAEYRAARDTHLARLRLQALGAAGELEVTVAAAGADKARSQVSLRQSQLAYCKVEAPFSGRVARLRVKSAESVNAGQPLVDIVNPSSLKAQMFVPSAWIVWVKPGTRLRLEVKETGQTYRATIAKVNSRVDGVSQQLEVEARVENPDGRLLPGMVGMAVLTQPGSR
jgi:membrane fusion protein (multidrug efflux system)